MRSLVAPPSRGRQQLNDAPLRQNALNQPFVWRRIEPFPMPREIVPVQRTPALIEYRRAVLAVKDLDAVLDRSDAQDPTYSGVLRNLLRELIGRK